MTGRQRLSATVEPDVLKAARRAVAESRAESVSAWVNDALKRQAEHDRRMKALSAAVRGYEAEFGVITDQDIRSAERYYRSRTVRVAPRGHPRRTKPARRAE